MSGKKKKSTKLVRAWGRFESTAEEDAEKDKESKYTKNDKVEYEGKVYVCRKSHWARYSVEPDMDVHLWKEE